MKQIGYALTLSSCLCLLSSLHAANVTQNITVIKDVFGSEYEVALVRIAKKRSLLKDNGELIEKNVIQQKSVHEYEKKINIKKPSDPGEYAIVVRLNTSSGPGSWSEPVYCFGKDNQEFKKLFIKLPSASPTLITEK